MSNYIVKPESIAKIANLITWANFNRWGLEKPNTLRWAFDYCINSDGFYKPDALCRSLAIMNYLAVDEMHKTSTPAVEIETYYNRCISLLDDNYTSCPEWKEGRRIIRPEHIQLFKTLQCYTYQIDCQCKSIEDQYKALKDLENAMAAWIISNSNDYINANWE